MEYGTIKHQRQRSQEERSFSFFLENPPKNSLCAYKSATNESISIVILYVLLFLL